MEGSPPRLIRLPNGNDALIVENRAPHTPGLQITGASYDQHDLHGIHYDGPGTGDAAQRCREQDMDGVDSEVLYTHPVYPSLWRGIKDNEPYKAMIWAYNRWLGEEYCAAAPDRLFAMGVIPGTGVDDAIAEMEFCAGAGLKGVCPHSMEVVDETFEGVPATDRHRMLAGNVIDFFHIEAAPPPPA